MASSWSISRITSLISASVCLFTEDIGSRINFSFFNSCCLHFISSEDVLMGSMRSGGGRQVLPHPFTDLCECNRVIGRSVQKE